MRRRETPTGFQLCATFLNISIHDEIMTKIQALAYANDKRATVLTQKNQHLQQIRFVASTSRKIDRLWALDYHTTELLNALVCRSLFPMLLLNL